MLSCISSSWSDDPSQYPVEVLNREADIRVRYRWVLSPGPLQGALSCKVLTFEE